MERAPSQVLPHTITSVERWTDKNKFGEGVYKLGLIGSSVIVERMVGVKTGVGGSDVCEVTGVSVDGVVVGGTVLSTNKLGVPVGSKENGVTVG